MSNLKHQRRARELERDNPGLKHTEALRSARAELGSSPNDRPPLAGRLEDILTASVGRQLVASAYGKYSPIAADVVHRLYLHGDDDRGVIELGIYPGDTLEQAKAL